MKVSGIYKIVNKINDKYYVGSSKDVVNYRWYYHKYDLRKNVHHNDHLQNAWNKYGENAFNFVVVEKVDEKDLLLIEQKYLDIAKAEQDRCYNLNFEARGGDWSEYSKKKMSEIMRGKGNPMYGKHFSDESKRKMSEAKNGDRRLCLMNTKSKEIFTGTQIEFRNKYNLKQSSVSCLFNGKRKIIFGWILSDN